MRAKAALLTRVPGKWEICDVEVDDPRDHEVLVRLVATGLCHSDEHFATGDMPVGTLPYCGGHGGAGVVEAVGPGVVGLSVGDHIVTSFIPACGRCRWCASGMQNLCDLGAMTLTGSRFEDPTSFRMHTTDGPPIGQAAGISTFAAHTTVSVNSAVKVDKDLPLDKVCLLGCGVGTGWGSSVNAANVQPGETVIIMGVGGVG